MNSYRIRLKAIAILFSMVMLLGVSALMSGCFSGNYLYVEGKGDIALVSFSIDRRIREENDTNAIDGPALIETRKNRENWWDRHQLSIDIMYNQFRNHLSEALPTTKLVPHDSIVMNKTYRMTTKHVPKIIMGKDISLGWSQISTEGLNWVSGFDNEKLDTLCTEFGVQLAMAVECEARWHVTDSVIEEHSGFATISHNMGYILLDVSVILHEKGSGIVWSRNYTGLTADDWVPLQWSSDEPPQMKKSDFPAQLENALLKVYPKIKADAIRGKEAMELQQKQAG